MAVHSYEASLSVHQKLVFAFLDFQQICTNNFGTWVQPR